MGMFSRSTPEVRAAERAHNRSQDEHGRAARHGDPAALARIDKTGEALEKAHRRAQAGGDTLGRRTGKGHR